MAEPQVFACPSCGASLHVEGDASTLKCQFCGNTVVVPEDLRRKAPAPAPGPAPIRIEVTSIAKDDRDSRSEISPIEPVGSAGLTRIDD